MLNGFLAFLNNTGVDSALVIKAGFYGVAALTVVFALLVVLSRNLFHSAMYLAVVLIGVGAVYLYLDAEFLAIVQVLVYVGAIVTLFIFSIMLTADLHKKIPFALTARNLASLGAVLILLTVLLKKMVLANPWQPEKTASAVFELADLGKSLMSRYVLPFEVLSVLLLAVLVGAVVIGKTEKR